jgi:hypothetical protein
MTVKTVTFQEVSQKVAANLAKIAKGDMYMVDVDKATIFDKYLDGFTPDLRQENNCNCCKSFIRQFGGIVGIENGKKVSIWDGIADMGEYQASIDAMQKYIQECPIVSRFFSSVGVLGTAKNYDQKRNVTWHHYHGTVPVTSSPDTKASRFNTNKDVLSRSLDISKEAVETVLELISQNSLYRGKEFEGLVRDFQKLQKLHAKAIDKELFLWSNSSNDALCKIKNSSIGTLLTDLSGGMELDAAVSRFEKMVAPHNYKRPTSLVTASMVENAKKKIGELGLTGAIERRFAVDTDLPLDNLIFIDKSSTMKDMFDGIATKPAKLGKVEEMGISDFLLNVVPSAKSIEVLVENSHLNNFCSLLTSDDSANMFKWDNKFSWDYTGNVADSIKERVKAAGGSVTGVLRASLSWSNYDDLDLHCYEPGGNHIYFGDRISRSTRGNLDVDMNAGGGKTRTPVENIAWPEANNMRTGKYEFIVRNYNKREEQFTGCTLQIESHGQTFNFDFPKNPSHGKDYKVTINWTKTDIEVLEGESKSLNREKWGITTNQFCKVRSILLSPNHWSGTTGNKHFIFVLDGCASDESLRGFHNEYLSSELAEHRKVFEILGNKTKVEPSEAQVSGLGFSETSKNSINVRVRGTFTRTIKVTF